MSRATTEHSARLLADVLEDCVPSFLEPLAMAPEEQHSRLVNERTRPTHWPETEGLVRRTTLWPVVGAPTLSTSFGRIVKLSSPMPTTSLRSCLTTYPNCGQRPPMARPRER